MRLCTDSCISNRGLQYPNWKSKVATFLSSYILEQHPENSLSNSDLAGRDNIIDKSDWTLEWNLCTFYYTVNHIYVKIIYVFYVKTREINFILDKVCNSYLSDTPNSQLLQSCSCTIYSKDYFLYSQYLTFINYLSLFCCHCP